jgi:Tfp pilus assembly protein PilP
MNRRKQLLVVLLGLLLVSLVYAWQRTPRQQSVHSTQTPSATPRPQKSAATAPTAAAAFRPLAYPEAEQAPVVIRRNLFTPLQVLEARAGASKAAALPPPPPPPPPPTPQELAREELNGFKPIGLLKKQGRLVAFIDKGGQIRLVRVGDALISGYQVTSISDDRLLMRSADGHELALNMR